MGGKLEKFFFNISEKWQTTLFTNVSIGSSVVLIVAIAIAIAMGEFASNCLVFRILSIVLLGMDFFTLAIARVRVKGRHSDSRDLLVNALAATFCCLISFIATFLSLSLC